MRKPLILIGGGGHCKSVIEVAESSGWKIKGILDLPEYIGSNCLGYKVIGTDSDIPKYVEECDFVITLGFIKDSHLRIELHNQVRDSGGNLATIVASSANVSEYSKIGPGSVVLHNACINAGAIIGESCIINTLANIEHDVEIGDYTHVSTGVMVNGDCKIGRASFIGSGSVIINQIEIGNDVIIGAGSIVNTDIKESGIYYGVPVKRH